LGAGCEFTTVGSTSGATSSLTSSGDNCCCKMATCTRRLSIWLCRPF
jgi:hypothetical protein